MQPQAIILVALGAAIPVQGSFGTGIFRRNNATAPPPDNVVGDFDLDIGQKLNDGLVQVVLDRGGSLLKLLDGDDDKKNGDQTQNTTIPVGEGNPHQRYLYTQISENVDCGDGPCEIAQTDLSAWSVGASGELGLTGVATGGIQIGRETQKGNVPNCQSMAPGDVLCVWYRKAYTSYEVQDREHSKRDEPESGNAKGQPYILTVPNLNGMGSAYICARNDRCTFQDDEFWNPTAIPGGPMKYPFKKKPWP